MSKGTNLTGNSRRKLRVNPELCTGCRACSTICALSHEHRLELHRARIRIEKDLLELDPPAFKPVFCRMCPNAPCVEVCPTGALYQDEENDVVVLDPQPCTGCGLCQQACPFGAIWMDDQLAVALKCDLCGGNPLCVQYCAPQALSFE